MNSNQIAAVDTSLKLYGPKAGSDSIRRLWVAA